MGGAGGGGINKGIEVYKEGRACEKVVNKDVIVEWRKLSNEGNDDLLCVI